MSQIVNFLISIKDSNYKPNFNNNFINCRIYPILVFTDYSYSLDGMNYFLRNKFKERIDEIHLTNYLRIENLITINLNTLIRYQEMFHNKKLNFRLLVREYSNKLNTATEFVDKTLTFDNFLHDKTKSINYQPPKILTDLLKKYTTDIGFK